MATPGIRLEGVERATRVFDSLEKKSQRVIIAKSVRAGGGPMLKAVRRRAPTKNRLVKRSLTLVIRRYSSGTVMAVVGQQKNKGFNSAKLKLKHRGGISGRGELTPIHLVERPTRAHQIKPKGKWLAIRVGGRLRFVRQVNHPGTKGAHFVRDGAKEAEPQTLRDFESKLQDETIKAVVG